MINYKSLKIEVSLDPTKLLSVIFRFCLDWLEGCPHVPSTWETS